MHRLKLLIILGAFVSLAIPATHAWAASADPLNGTWHLNAEKSKFLPGQAMKSQTRVYEVSGQSVKQTADGIDAQGKAVRTEFTAKYDGKDYPVTGNPDADTVSAKRLGKYSAKSVLKKDGKVVQTSTRHIAKDGKTMTFKIQGTDANGKKSDGVLVFDKQ
jgi:hypothetical protein